MLSEEGKLWVYWIGEARISLVNILFIYLPIYLFIYLSNSYSSIFYLLSLFNIFARVARNSPLLPSFQLNEKTQIEPFSCNLKARLTQNLNVPRIRAIDATMQVLFSIFFFSLSLSFHFLFLLRFSSSFSFSSARSIYDFLSDVAQKIGRYFDQAVFYVDRKQFPQKYDRK